MDVTIANTIITAVAGVITGFIGLWAGKNVQQSSTPKNIREMQLERLFTPIDKLLFSSGIAITDETISELSSITLGNYALIPPDLMSSIKLVLNTETRNEETIKTLRIIASSYYNWTRRSLGYPCDSSAIKRGHTPTHERNSIIWSVVLIVLAMIWSISTFITIFAMIGANLSAPEWALIAAFFITIIGMFLIFILYPHSKNR